MRDYQCESDKTSRSKNYTGRGTRTCIDLHIRNKKVIQTSKITIKHFSSRHLKMAGPR